MKSPNDFVNRDYIPIMNFNNQNQHCHPERERRMTTYDRSQLFIFITGSNCLTSSFVMLISAQQLEGQL